MFFEKWTKEGLIEANIGMWIPIIIFFGFGLFFLLQARNDSRLFEVDTYKFFFKKIAEKYKKSQAV
jgi:lipopolysaccharide export system permease protein